MNTLAAVSTIMSKKLITVNPKDNLEVVKDLFDNNRIHHIPVVRFTKIVGIISKTDVLHFIKGYSQNSYDEVINTTRLKNYFAEDIMTTGIAKLSPDDKIKTALKVFQENLFHAIPVVQGEELVGIITTYDIINTLAKEPIKAL